MIAIIILLLIILFLFLNKKENFNQNTLDNYKKKYYYNYDINLNSNKSITTPNTGIDYVNVKFTFKKEIKQSKLIKLLNNVKSKYKNKKYSKKQYQGKDNTSNNTINNINNNKEHFIFVKEFIRDKVREELDNLFNYDEYPFDQHEKELYYAYDEILYYSVNTNTKIKNYKFIINIYNKQFIHNMFIYCDIIFDYFNLECYINDIELLGIGNAEKINFKDLLKSEYKLDKKNKDCSLSYTDECNFSVNKIMKNVSRFKKIINNVPDKYQCLNKKADYKYDCIIPDSKNKIGIWDKKCTQNEDCPFYKRNTNYNNNFGGCNDGYCEYPVGMQSLSFTKASNTKPLCYNCIKKNCKGIECYTCCEEQKNKTQYPDLSSPDYMFIGDQYIRRNQRDLLESKNLKVSHN